MSLKLIKILTIVASFGLLTGSWAEEEFQEPDFTGPSQCEEGVASGYYSCRGVDLLAQVSLDNKGQFATSGNDIWGWTDPENGSEYAIMGLSSKTAFVDISEPTAPVYKGDLKTHSRNSMWRDVKIYKNYAYIVSEAYGHGLQVFDLTQLRGGQSDQTFSETAHYGNFGSAHNIFINEDTGYAYVVGSNTCDAGMHMVDIRQPANPKFVGCIDRSIFEDVSRPSLSVEGIQPLEIRHGEDYTHDVQCVVYNGPDFRYHNREICAASNADTVNIVDVTDKANPVQLSVTDYGRLGYTHQGWLSEDHRFFFLGDELDEQKYRVNTTTIVWDLSDLENPKIHHEYVAETKSIDHNMYVKGNLIFQSNYQAGLRILDISDVANKNITEVGFFDTMPGKDGAVFEGTWSVYPYFPSGNVVLSGINGHLYILRPNL